MTSDITVKTSTPAVPQSPCEWILMLAHNRLKSGQYTEKMINELLLSKKMASERTLYFLDYMVQENIKVVPIGQRGRDFTEKTDTYCANWRPPYTKDKVEYICKIVNNLEKDLTKDEKWPQLRETLSNIRDKISLDYQETIETAIQQILLGYKNYMVHLAFFHEKQEDESPCTFKLNDLCHKELLYMINETVSTNKVEEVYDVLKSNCQSTLKKEVDELIDYVKRQSTKGQYLLHIAFHMQCQINFLKRTPEYHFLDSKSEDIERAEKFLDQLKTGISKLNGLFKTICNAARPGLIIEEMAIKEINQIIKDPIFDFFIELGPEAIAHYINSPENIKYVHELVMQTRVNVCKEFLMDEGLLKQELQKATNYRVRRDIIERIFHYVLNESIFEDDKKWPGAQITQKQESYLLMLQHEFLQAIYRQVEAMTYEDALTFLDNFRHHPLIAPLPKTHSLAKKNRVTFDEYEYLVKNCQTNAASHMSPKEEPSLHHLDCPIEQDIIGEMTKRFVEAIQHRSPEWHSFNAIFDITEKTYKKLLDPNFKCDPVLEDFTLASNCETKLLNVLQQEENLLVRLERILELYDFVKDASHFKSTSSLVEKLQLKQSEQARAIQLLQNLYYEGANDLINNTKHYADHDKHKLYVQVLLPALESELFNDKISPKESKKAKQKLETLLEKL